jgi:hypothetical protein
MHTEGIGKLSTADGKAFADPEVLRRLTSSVSCALDEAAAALTRMRAESSHSAGQVDTYVFNHFYWVLDIFLSRFLGNSQFWLNTSFGRAYKN